MATLSGNKIKDTYQSLVKFSDNGNITTSAKQLTDGFGNNSPVWVSTTQVGIGVTPESGLNLHVYGDAKIGSNLTVIGNLVVEGSTTTVGTDTLTVKDPLIVLANNNTSTDAVDIGFYGKYTPSGTTLYSGLFREALTGKYRLFKDLQVEPTTTVNTSGTGYAVATLIANLEGNVTGGTISGTTGTFSGNVDIDGTLDVDDVISVEGSGFGRIEVGGASGGYIDLKAPNSDDYDFRLITSTGGAELYSIDTLKFYTGSGTDLAITIDTSQDVTFEGNIILSGTVDGRDVSTDGNKLDGIEAGADVTDTANVRSAGALMDDELTNISAVKAINQQLTTTSNVQFTSVTSDLTGDVTGNADTATKIASITNSNIVQLTDTQTLTNKTIDADNNTISDLEVDNLKAGVLDTDLTSVSASDDTLASAKAIKTYVDSQVGANNELSEVLANGNTTGGTDIAVSAGDDITFTSTSKAIFNSALEIYHDGSHSYIKDVGTGDLKLQGGNDIYLLDSSGNVMIEASEGGSVDLFYSGSKKLETTSTGVTVTGNVNATSFVGNAAIVNQVSAGTSGGDIKFKNNAGTDRVIITDSGDVGIGTTSPEDKLDIVGYLRISDNKTANTNKTNRIRGEHYDITEQPSTFMFMNSFSADTTLHIGGGSSIENAATLLRFFTAANNTTVAGTERMRIDSSGHLLVNKTSSSGDILQVQGNNNVFASRLDGSTTVGQSYGLRVRAGTNSTDTSLLVENTGGTDLFIIKGDGNVGIGTTSPTRPLHVNGAGINFVAEFQSTDDKASILIQDDDTLNYIHSQDGYLSLGGQNQLSDNNLNINSSDGNVGIGTTSPEEKLDVTGSVLISNDEFYKAENTSGTSYKIAGITSGNVVQIGAIDYTSAGTIFAGGDNISITTGGASGTTRVKIDSSGKVGIGTTSPSVELEIASAAPQIRLTDTDGGYCEVANVSGHLLLQADKGNTQASSYMRFDVDGSERMRIDSSGNVMINKSTDDGFKFSVNGAIAGTNVYATGIGSSFVFGSSVSEGEYIQHPNATNDIAFITNASESVRIKGDGNVGIGTTLPDAKLSLYHATDDVSINVNTGTGGSYPKKTGISFGATSTSLGGDSEFKGGAGIQAINTASSNNPTDLAFWTTSGGSPTERMRIDNSGNVGIGTTSPSGDLHVVGKTGTAGRIYISDIDDGASATDSVLAMKSATHGYYYNRDSGNLYLGTNDNPNMMIINSSGQVGIGTTSPASLLHIQGSTYNRVQTYFSGSYISGFKFSDLNGGIWYDAGADDLYLNANHSNSQVILQSGGSTTLTLDASNNATFGGKVSLPDNQYLTWTGSNTRMIGNSDYLIFQVAASDKMAILSNGNVGINTTSPSQKLHIVGDQLIFGDLLLEGTANSFRTISMNTSDGSDNQTLSLCGGATSSSARGGRVDILGNEVTSTGGTVKIIAGNVSTGNIDFFTANTQRMVINNSGNVGIGTSSPTRSLTVYSDVNATNILGVFDNSGTTASNCLIAFSDPNSTAGQFSTRLGSVGDALAFYTNGANERMRIDSNGDVLIGNSVVNPASGFSSQRGFGYDNSTGNLEVASTSGTAMTIGRNESDDGEILELRKESSIKHSFGSTTSYLLSNVGIGTTSPVSTHKVTIEADSSNGTSQLYLKRDSTDQGLYIDAGAGSAIYNSHEGTNTIYGRHIWQSTKGTDTVERMRIDDSGNVGIGTDSPIYKLEVNGDSTSGVISVKNAANGRDTFRSENASGTRTVNIGNDGNGHGNILVRGSGGTTTNYIAGNGTSYFNGGNVAIGNTNSDYGLLVEGTFAASNTGSCPDGCIYAFTTASSQVNINVDTAIGPITAQSKLHIGQSATIGTNFTTAVNNSQLFVHKVGTNSDSNVIFAGGNTASSGGTGALSFGQNGQGYSHWVFYHKPISTNQSSVGSISTTSSATSYNTSSDYRLKENVIEMTGALDRVSQLKPSRFNFIEDADKTVDGFLAHEVQDIVPEAITGEKDAVDEEGNAIYQGIDQAKLVPLLVGAIQELKAEIEQLKTQINK